MESFHFAKWKRVLSDSNAYLACSWHADPISAIKKKENFCRPIATSSLPSPYYLSINRESHNAVTHPLN